MRAFFARTPFVSAPQAAVAFFRILSLVPSILCHPAGPIVAAASESPELPDVSVLPHPPQPAKPGFTLIPPERSGLAFVNRLAPLHSPTNPRGFYRLGKGAITRMPMRRVFRSPVAAGKIHRSIA